MDQSDFGFGVGFGFRFGLEFQKSFMWINLICCLS